MRQLKLIWDFRGPTSQVIAKHHVVHLKEFIKLNGLKLDITGVDTMNDMHSIAYMVVDEDEMIMVRDALRPHRGQLYSN